MKNCPRCAAELPDKARFCLQCGAAQDFTVNGAPQQRLSGSGAAAQDQSVAAGEGGAAIGGDVNGDVVIGSQTTIFDQQVKKQINVARDYIEQQIVAETGTSPEVLRRRYLRELAREANRLPWGSLEREYADPERGESIGLAEVYTALDTTELERMEHEEELRRFLARLEQDKAKRVSAQEMTNRESRLLILGDPGSGKSTFLNHLTYVLSQAGLAEDADPWLERVAPWDHGPLLTVHIELRDLTTQVDERKRGHARLLLQHLKETLTACGSQDFWPTLQSAIQDEEESVLFALDGLDEVPTTLRGVVVETVQDFADRYRKHRYIVTCRPYAYVGQRCQLRNFSEVTLAPFNEEQVRHFVTTWYHLLARRGRLATQEADVRAGQLMQAVQRGDLWGLAHRPLLLTVMTLLHTFRGQLPEDRTELYADAVDLLLRRWEGRLGQETGLLEQMEMPELKMSDLQAGLFNVAFQAHSRGETAEGRTADIEEAELRKWLAPYLGDDWNKAGEFVVYIRERAGLLVRHKTEAYTFPHRSFQEFLAACYLVTESQDYAREAAQLVREDFSRWREVFILAAGHAARTHRLGQAIGAVNALCPRDIDQIDQPDVDAFRRATLAGEALLEIGLVGVQREEMGRAALMRVRDWLVTAVQADQALKPVERNGAGNVLAGLGDPRPGVGVDREAGLPDIVWCPVPAGLFLMGSTDTDPVAQANEKPQIDMTLSAFRIGKYPVTNTQFGAFVEAGGYSQRRYWTHEGWQWKEQQGWVRPKSFPFPFGLPNHPAVGVSWYEAMSYCAWLTDTWRSSGLIAKHEAVRLPSEAEWEKAARGTDGRLYPWGDEFDESRCNIYETGIATTSAAGIFPAGASPYGSLDMAGPVWEWTSSLYRDYPYRADDGREDPSASTRRVVRGGSFRYDQRCARCTFRDGISPFIRDSSFGFRVVVSSISSSLVPSGSDVHQEPLD